MFKSTFIIGIILFVLSRSVAPAASAGIPVAVLQTFDAPVQIQLPQTRLTIDSHSLILLEDDGKSNMLKAGGLLRGGVYIQELTPKDQQPCYLLDSGLIPGAGADYVRMNTSWLSLYPELPAVVAPDSTDGCSIVVDGTPATVKSSTVFCHENTVLSLKDAVVKNDYAQTMAASRCTAVFHGKPIDSLSINGRNCSFSVKQSYRFPVAFSSNDILSKEKISFHAESVSVSLDRDDPFSRSVSVSFVDDTSSLLSNRLQTGPRAAIAFSLSGGYRIIAAPSTILDAGLSLADAASGSAKGILRLLRGSIIVLPEYDKPKPGHPQKTPDQFQPLVVQGRIIHSSKFGEATFYSVDKDGGAVISALLSLSGGQKARKSAGSSVGSAESTWMQFVKTNESLGIVPWTLVNDALTELAKAKRLTVPLFSLVPVLPAQRTTLFDGFTMNVDGNRLTEEVYVEIIGPASSKQKKRDIIAKLLPRSGKNILEIHDGQTSDPVMAIDFFRPYGKPLERKKGDLVFSFFSYFSKNTRLSKAYKAIRPDEVTQYKVAYDFFARQYEKHPYKVICLVIFLLALSVYLLATVPVMVLSSVWYLIGYIRGEPCQACKMPLEKEYLPPVPLDAHLAMTTRLAAYSMTPELAGIENKVHTALNISTDTEKENIEKLPVFVEGDCVWCLRCSKGKLRFRIVRHGEEIETGNHQLDHPGMLEYVKRWHEQHK